MVTHMIVCPYCHGTCPVDARFCIECSASLQQSVTHTTHRLSDSPASLANTLRATAHATPRFGRIRRSVIGTVLGGLLVLIAALASRISRIDSVAALILTIGVVQLVRRTMRGQIQCWPSRGGHLFSACAGNAHALGAHDMYWSWCTAGGLAFGRYASHTELSLSLR